MSEECRYFLDMLQETTHVGQGAMETDMQLEHQESLDVPFLMHVIELFESAKQPEYSIKFAFAALQEAKDDEATQAFLWSVIFKSSLALKDYEQAYFALLSGPYPPNADNSLYAGALSSRYLQYSVIFVTCAPSPTSLRKYVVVLCTKGQVGLLCQLPFAGLQQDVVQAFLFCCLYNDQRVVFNSRLFFPLFRPTDSRSESASRGYAAHGRWSEPQLL